MEELDRLEGRTNWKSFIPAILVIAGAFTMLGLRLQIGSGFISDGAMMMVALACYIFAGVCSVNAEGAIYGRADVVGRIGSCRRISPDVV